MIPSPPMDSASSPPIGRFAPSPTGPLHFGSLVAAVGSYCLARHGGGRWLLRMDDLDQPRVVSGAADGILRTLEALELCWDGEILWQSRRFERYREVLTALREAHHLFDCGCSRREILASAPHPGEDGPLYPGTCRSGLPPHKEARSVRVRVPEVVVDFIDGVFGPQRQNLASSVGDFVLHRADGVYSYQLATVVDDLDTEVTQVVRGVDLLGSTPRQLFLYRLLNRLPPTYLHLPLALEADGRKISKRDVSVRLEQVAPATECLWQALLFLGQSLPEEMRGAPCAELLAWIVPRFDVATIPRQKYRPAPKDYQA